MARTTHAPRDLLRDVEVVERTGPEGRYLFAINHTACGATISGAVQLRLRQDIFK